MSREELVRQYAEQLKQMAQLSPEDEPIFRKVMADSKLWQMADVIDEELPDFKLIYDFYARIYFNLLRKSVFKNLPPDGAYSMIFISFMLFETCVQAKISELYRLKQSGQKIDRVDVGSRIHDCTIQSLELHTAPLKQAKK